MRRQAVPNNEQLAGNDAQQFFEEDHHLGTLNGIGKQLKVQIPFAETGDQRQVLPVEVMKQDRRLAAWSPSATAVWLLRQSAFVNEDDSSAFREGFFLAAGQVIRFHWRMAFSSRSSARPTGRCGLQPKPRKMRQTWPG